MACSTAPHTLSMQQPQVARRGWPWPVRGALWLCLRVAASGREARQGEEGVEGMWRRVNERVESPSRCPKREMEQQERCCNGGARSGAWRPRRHFIEHVARVGVGKVGGYFGLVPGRI